MSEKEVVKKYSNDDLTVVWKPGMCIHSKKCWKGLLQVFNPQNRPWINMEGASTKRIMKQVDECPSGALSYISKETKTETEMSDEIKVEALENGPLMVHGALKVTNSDGSVETKKRATAFCRCGASANKPYCDGEHNNIGFTA